LSRQLFFEHQLVVLTIDYQQHGKLQVRTPKYQDYTDLFGIVLESSLADIDDA
jgi:hypothetical protein